MADHASRIHRSTNNLNGRRKIFLRLATSALLWFLVSTPLAQEASAQMIVAHRGASADAPENTLAAFREAWRQNADGIEGDFYLTRDNQVVCVHDKTTERTGGKSLSITQSSLAELQKLEYGAWKNEKFRGEPIPTLGEVIDHVPAGKKLVIELKMGPEIVPHVQRIIAAKSLVSEQILIISFDAKTVAKSKELMPHIKAHWLTSYKRKLGIVSPTVDQIIRTIKSCGADGLGTKGDRKIVSAEFVERLREAGIQELHVWTVDDPSDAKYFQSLGAIGITTNQPGKIRQSLGL